MKAQKLHELVFRIASLLWVFSLLWVISHNGCPQSIAELIHLTSDVSVAVFWELKAIWLYYFDIKN